MLLVITVTRQCSSWQSQAPGRGRFVRVVMAQMGGLELGPRANMEQAVMGRSRIEALGDGTDLSTTRDRILEAATMATCHSSVI